MRVSMPDYLALKAFSGGLATTLLNDSPFAAWYGSPWNPDRPRDDSGVADIGTYAHAMLLEGGIEGLVVVDAPDWRTKDAKAARDEAYAHGELPILAHKVAAVEAMVESAQRFLETTELAGILEGEPEETLTWTEAGVDCKIRPDMLAADRRVILSYKTTPGSAEPRAWIRRILPQHEVGMALYERGIRACCGVDQTRVVHLVQSQERPYACSLVALAPSRQEYAERQLDTALAIWRECLETKRFPSYPPVIHYAELEAWRAATVEDDLMRAAGTYEFEKEPA